MAKKLITGYEIDTLNNGVFLPDNIHKENILLMTNVDTGEIIYNFADGSIGANNVSYIKEEDRTFVQLKKSFVDASIVDQTKLQIFIDEEATKFEPIEALLDPVSKFRVSNPGNLIDTDFEYGLQSTKWETLQTVNNIPTVFSNNGDTPIEGIISVETTADSKQVKVITSLPHNVAVGDPLSVQGVEDYLSEGYFVVSGVVDALTFFYELDRKAQQTRDISGSYTTIITAKFFEGSPLPVSTADGAEIDGGNPTTATVTTDEAHGFSERTKVYVRNTIGPKKFTLEDPNATAPDGRPYIDGESYFSEVQTIDTSVSTNRGDLLDAPVRTYDWLSTYNIILTASNIDTTNNWITSVGHGLKTNFCLLFNNYQKGVNNCGLEDGRVYYVNVLTDDTFQLMTTYNNTGTVVTLQAPVSNPSKPVLNLVYKVEGSAGTSRETAFHSRNKFSRTASSSLAAYYNGTRSFTTLLGYTSTLGTSPSNMTLYQLRSYGDLGSGNEYIYLRVYGKGYRGLGYGDFGVNFGTGNAGNFSYRYYYRNDNLTRCMYQSGTGWYVQGYMRGQYFTYYWYGTAYWRASGFNSSAPDTDSGSDLTVYDYGLGQKAPEKIVAFQGEYFNSYSSSADGFSYLAQQRQNGRYITINNNLNYQVTDGNNRDGTFSINYSDGTEAWGTGSQFYYAFADTQTSTRNTFYKEGHGLEDGQSVVLNIANTNYNAGERFAFADSTGNETSITAKEIETVVTVISDNEFRLQINVAPNTDDITQYPENFSIEFRRDNELYNTFYVQNHKITGTAEAVYLVDGQNEEDPLTFRSTANTSEVGYQFEAHPRVDGTSNPSLVVFRGNSYNIELDANGYPFYITTDDGTNWTADGYAGEYTTGVTGSRTEFGTLNWTVDAGAPDNLFYYSATNSAYSGTIEVRDVGTAIGGLENANTYNLSRVNDSRLTVQVQSSESSSATSSPYGASNNNSQRFFVPVQTLLGIVPTGAIFNKIEYRGDFSGSNEYVLVQFDDGDIVYVGQIGGVDGAVWQDEEYFTQKNVTELLVNNGGVLGVWVNFYPTSQVGASWWSRYNYVPWASETSNWWEIRFSVTGDTATTILDANTATGLQEFEVQSLIGAYDGVYEIISVPKANQFEIAVDFQVPIREYKFDASSIAGNIIDSGAPHNLITGEKVTYFSNNTPAVVGSGDAQDLTFYAIVKSDTEFGLSSSYLGAVNNLPISINPTSNAYTQTFTSRNMLKAVKGTGDVSVANNDTHLVGSGTKFLSSFKRFDNIWINNGEYAKPYVVDAITTDEDMTVFDAISPGLNNVDYYYSSQIVLRPDGFSLHKPFDGGVDITAGTSPNSKIVRQSRKYFRYQSGKGIQNSFAINFNPPRLIASLSRSANNEATVSTQAVHNLKINDEIKINNAVVTNGDNFYNGNFTVKSIVDDFTFKYDMSGDPTESRAGGFPTITRGSWQDSYVRGGMFDDQNGFFYEFDGNEIYAVRRSSTLQLPGSVSVERGSQVVIGKGTAFTSQVAVRDKIVIRGQTYQIVEVSSDRRLVVQPAYRGVDARNVKVTKTVDARTPQSEWNIDKCDGSGPSGFILDSTKIQMAYADYSWYGAGKIRYGFKDQNGHVTYVHEYKHNNRLDESYFRSGNLPGRYEIENGPGASTAPTLFHFGTSIIMDGRFDDDKAYLFSAQSKPFSFTNGGNFTAGSLIGDSTFELITLNGKRVYVYAMQFNDNDAADMKIGMQISDDQVPGEGTFPSGTYITQMKASSTAGYQTVYTNWPALSVQPSGTDYPAFSSATTFYFGETNAIDLTQPLPLVSIRLAPSVDSSLTGAVGEREIINRMQLQLKQAGITSDRDVEIFLILNPIPSNFQFLKAQNPSLSELIEHNPGDTLLNGTTIYSLKSSAGSVEIDLGELLEMGNSIRGGDGVFPAGPDLLTLAVQPQSTSGVNATNPFFVTGKISWSESQA